ncbi:NAD(P)-dependent dehydrogenase (short-subunit alcohol dehydrogenase family) [Tenacibaculum adriaticum]|uniref:NAD(P)-dependent dehydrogenase (Short-subunit alcohol dehydrogenase family) n=1 Tax=Tenacibaculum adriaticum TaxID=413713 RepID=A0A5S5DSU4_9FLAO|nr:SDR family NAD(P)-dependent oxidoreductase [Tenacibaculum adriaticum]TYP98947.1 NAD(P)-dependent dehydrogenase (short-subunit alcohol dehydrogenase family) [Tenacibaculum adriaticum]
MHRLKNKVVIITGGSSGIGSATAKLFLAEGAKVMLVGRTEATLKDTVKHLNSKDVAYTVADVSKANDTIKYRDATLAVFKKIDVFFNNAGIEGLVKPITEYPEEDFDKVISINLKGVWLGCKYIIPKMSNGGSVMITSSVAGLKGFKGMGAYVASKHAVIGIMRTAALEFADRKIRVNSIHPGPVNTSMMRSLEQQIDPNNPVEAKKGFESNIPFKRYAEADEVALLALFLASDSSNYITGTKQIIDGGMIIN